MGIVQKLQMGNIQIHIFMLDGLLWTNYVSTSKPVTLNVRNSFWSMINCYQPPVIHVIVNNTL